MSGNDNHLPAEATTLQGRIPSLATPAERRAALDAAFDYRGDVLIHTADGRQIEGYIFDHQTPADGESFVRMIPQNSNDRVKIAYDQITRLEFTGRDTTAGKSFETWVKKYQEKKALGESANIECEPLE